MGKRYDAKKVNAFIDKLDEAVRAYLGNLSLLDSAYDRYTGNDTYLGLAAETSKQFISQKQQGFNYGQY